MYASAITSINYYDANSISSSSSAALTGTLVMGIGGLAYSVSRVWEIIDIFGTVEKQKKNGILVSMSPSIIADEKGIALALKYSY